MTSLLSMQQSMTSPEVDGRQPEIDELLRRLDLSLVEPDPDYDSDDTTPPSDRQADHTCAGKYPSSAAAVNGGNRTAASERRQAGSAAERPTSSIQSQQQQTDDISRQPNQQIQRLKSDVVDEDDKKKEPAASAGARFSFMQKRRQGSTETKKGHRRKTLEQLKVDSLPQSFVAKYVGCKACRGLWGIQHTRGPVDSLVEDLRHLSDHSSTTAPVDRRDDLPLVRVDVVTNGISITVHPRNRSRRPVSDLGLLPLEFISYAVQDTRYSRIFAFVLVRELSSRARATECHAFLCDAPSTARTLALSVALAFRQNEERLAGKPFRFVVDLRWPDEINDEQQQQQQQAVDGGSTAASGKTFQTAEFEV